uniref:Uncharacterized protein n=1 Tax=Anguilla anguilla TaxID=7936 RepID=A0A0E9P578_ANGAN
MLGSCNRKDRSFYKTKIQRIFGVSDLYK